MTDHQPPPAVEAIGRLEELARAARDTPTEDRNGYVNWRGMDAKAAFEKAANPQAILSLIEERRALREALLKVSTWRRECHAYDADMGHPLRSFSDEDWMMVEMTARAALDRRAGT